MRNRIFSLYYQWWFKWRIKRMEPSNFQYLAEDLGADHPIGILALASRLTPNINAAWFAQQLNIPVHQLKLLVVDDGVGRVDSVDRLTFESHLKNCTQNTELEHFKNYKFKYLFHVYPPNFWSVLYLGLHVKAGKHISFWTPDQGPGELFLPTHEFIDTESLMVLWNELAPQLKWN